MELSAIDCSSGGEGGAIESIAVRARGPGKEAGQKSNALYLYANKWVANKCFPTVNVTTGGDRGNILDRLEIILL